MRPTIRFALLALSLVAAPVALEAQDPEPTQKKAPARRPRGDRNKLTRVELDEAGPSIQTARDAIRLLRPQWLSPALGRVTSGDMDSGFGSGVTTAGATKVVVYVDGIRQPELEPSLATVNLARVVEMRYLDQNRAIQMHGPGHEQGVIEITTLDKR